MTKPKSVFDQLSEGITPGSEAGVQEVDASEAKEPAVQVPSLTAGLDNNLLAQFVALMIAKEGREAATAQRELDRQKAIQKQRDRNAKDQDSKVLLKQARCKHLKGGRRGPKTQNKDYAVYQHQFINFTEYIRCCICGMKWYPRDTVEYLLRNGHKVSNHTKIGWREAVGMCDASTNTLSTSERMPSIAAPETLAQNKDAAGLNVVPRFVDLEGQEVTDVQI
jgi:hypothetical protein